MKDFLISICIPAYKNTDYLERLLDSIAIQTFQDFEVIVTDDSPGETVKDFIDSYSKLTNIRYYRNVPALGTPENWNEGLRKAKGKWIKIMHDDDWFNSSESLGIYAEKALSSRGDFVFAAYENIFLNKGTTETVIPSQFRLKQLVKDPVTLFSKNIIGPPSVLLHRNDQTLFYDRSTKWVVDIDFYIRRLEKEKIHFIDRPLINVGMSDQQVTVDCINNRIIQIPENFYLLHKVGTDHLRNLLVYDAWWRLMRNLEIVQVDEIRAAGYHGSVPDVIKSMISWQRSIPRKILNWGPFSKITMFLHYLINRNKIGR